MLRTDAQGVFRASGLHPGQVEVLVGARLYALWAEHVVLESGAKRTLEARLEYGVSVSGSLSDEQGASVAPALVGWETPSELYFVEDVWPVFTQADAHGRYRLEGLPSGKLTLCASHGQGASRRRSVRDFETRPGEHVVWDVVFDDGLTITGRAQDPAGAPLVGWAVQAMQVPNVDRSLPEIATTAADGRFVITNLRDVPHQVLLYRTKNSDDWLAKVENVRPGEAEVVLVFDEADRPAAYLTGSVVGADGRPVVGADLFARPHTNDGSCNGKTDAPDGSFRIGPLRQGGHELSIQAAGQPSFEVAVPALAAGEERDLGVLVVPATGDAEIVLTTRASAPLEKPVVLLFSTPTRAHPLSSDDDAITFRTGPLFPGTYRLFVVAENAASEIHPIEIRPGETARARFELAPGARRLFFLRPAANDPVLGPVRIVVRDAEERVVLEDQRAFERAVKPGENHSLYMASFPYGTLRIDVQADDGRSASLAFTVQSGPVPPPLELQFPAKRDL